MGEDSENGRRTAREEESSEQLRNDGYGIARMPLLSQFCTGTGIKTIFK